MKYFTFNYTKKFSCINTLCKHNCCEKWKIHLDKASFNKYLELSKKDDRFINGKTFDDKTFIFTSSRCPFLEKDNLCYIINTYGEKFLCKTCKTHPRFKNFFSNRIETGLGLYCEEACRQILSLKGKMALTLEKQTKLEKKPSSFEKKLLQKRRSLLKITQNRSLTLEERISNLKNLTKINLDKKPFKEWIILFKGLEKLSPSWQEQLNTLSTINDFNLDFSGFEREFEQLICYFIYRHVSRAIDLLDVEVRLSFCLLSLYFISTIFHHSKNRDFENLVEICRLYSSEIECSDENVINMLNAIESLYSFI